MNWKNVDLKSPYESSQNIIDSYDFDTLLLEISCNIKEINKETINKHFKQVLKLKIESAKTVFNDNLDNILKEAIEYRNIE
jgi:hypothetical protein